MWCTNERDVCACVFCVQILGGDSKGTSTHCSPVVVYYVILTLVLALSFLLCHPPITGADQSLQFVCSFIRHIRQHRFWGNAYIIYICESNTGHESGHHARVLMENFPRIYCIRDHMDPNRNYGVWTSVDRKQDYALVLRGNLNMQRMCFAADFISSTGPTDTAMMAKHNINAAQSQNKTPFSMFQNELFSQMQRARTVVRSKTSNSVTARITWDAKCRDDGTPCPGLRDDNLLALCMASYFSERFLMHQIPTVEYHMFDMM